MRARIHIPKDAVLDLGFVMLVGLIIAACAWTEEPPPLVQTAKQVSEENGILIPFTLDAPGYVTLVIEDDEGRRVRNLTAGARYPAGSHTIYWDGYDVGKAVKYKTGNVGTRYDIRRRRVAPGVYRVRGLVHEGLTMRYEMAVQSPGTPPWHTRDGSGAWLADHTPPNDIVFLPGGSAYGSEPQMMACANFVETGHGLMWIDLDGRKLYGMRQGWEGAFALARDAGPNRDPNTHAYSISFRKGKLKLFAHTAEYARKRLLGHKIDGAYDPKSGMALAVYNRKAVVSLPRDGQLLFIDIDGNAARPGRTAAASHPKGLTIDEAGRLYVIEDRQVKRYEVDWEHDRLMREETLVNTGLEDPHRITRDAEGRLYVSDWGESHQVKVFAGGGQWLRTIGAPGGPQTGRYDEQRMHHPNGLAVDDRGRLWVAELDQAPKRISQWTTDGAFVRAFYGPPMYGGGGMLDPADSTRFYYPTSRNRRLQGVNAGIAFSLDWQTGEATPETIYKPRDPRNGAEATLPYQAPVQPIRVAGRLYLVNTFNQAFHGMRNVVGIWLWDEATAMVRLVAVVGFHDGNKNHRWAELDRPDLAAHRPDGVAREQLFYVWSDGNKDARVQPDEVQYAVSENGGGRIYAGENLKVLTSWLQQLDAPQIDDDGVPRFDLSTWKTVADAQKKGSGDAFYAGSDWVIRAGGPIQGFYRGAHRWSYHSQYFDRGSAPVPAQYAGHLIETSRVLGLPVQPRAGDAGYVWAINSDKGALYLFTADGLLLQELGGDRRVTPLLRIPNIERGQIVENVSFDEENFWPHLVQLDSGSIFLTTGREHTSVFRLEGFETIERRDFGAVTVSEAMVAGLKAARVEPATRQQNRKTTIALNGPEPRLDGDLAEWDEAEWEPIDAALGLAAAARVSGGTLYVAYRTDDPALLDNEGAEGWQNLFASGGGLDVMLQLPKKTRKTKQTRAVRLFVTRLGHPQTGPVRAVFFQQGGQTGRAEPVTYNSPLGETVLKNVVDVSERVTLAQSGGSYELAVPLAVLGLNPKNGMKAAADVGVLLGNGVETQARLYWSNKTSTSVSDLSREARLEPQFWGTWVFRE